ncbi:MAG: hypothetical protein A3F61_04045 [Candidatus Blackburnbacteria bacterium RIFCSPHIGHO2_12_FULL_41_13b]|uniref:Uncharacterized protein n=1 Tax=Candidatus Blackburnbacteria bacterium RIFCSPHIGHO2_12_FULL_41_13b TaxID=1797517 RepID=A0A1G1VAI0_9BACT|nr:MAG: hypothetical protein A3F61_04045 [Candidatus Blackburnbacteria bacterium RIFCSPHIGHO2_12_FULL_41_13b]
MISPERPFSSGQPEFAIIGMARMFAGREFPNNRYGLAEAMVLLREQHERTLPGLIGARLHYMVAQDDLLVVATTEQLASLALENDDYQDALMGANYLYAYGDVDFRGSLGVGAFALSLGYHRAFAERVRDRFSSVDPYLTTFGEQMFEEIQGIRTRGDTYRELGLLRAIVNTVALNGTLGEKAKQQFDPFAVFYIEK